MGKFIVQQEKQKVRKETMGKYFYDLSRLTFAAMVLGGNNIIFSGN